MNAPLAPKSVKNACRLGLGTWALGGGSDWGDTPAQDFQEVLAFALQNGIELIDTSPIYGWGAAETFLGSQLKNHRHQVLLATKCGISRKGGRADHDLRAQSIIAECEQSLQRLQTDYIDLYQIHWPDPKVPLEIAAEALVKLKEQGKIRGIGVCNFSSELLEKVSKLFSVESLQNPFSLLRPHQQEELSFCAKQNISFIAYGVLEGGILSAKYRQAPNFRRCDARRYFYKCYYGAEFVQAQQTAARVAQVAAEKGVAPSCVALAWALTQEQVGAVLVGARNVRQIQQNLSALSVTLTTQEKEFLLYG